MGYWHWWGLIRFDWQKTIQQLSAHFYSFLLDFDWSTEIHDITFFPTEPHTLTQNNKKVQTKKKNLNISLLCNNQNCPNFGRKGMCPCSSIKVRRWRENTVGLQGLYQKISDIFRIFKITNILKIWAILYNFFYISGTAMPQSDFTVTLVWP